MPKQHHQPLSGGGAAVLLSLLLIGCAQLDVDGEGSGSLSEDELGSTAQELRGGIVANEAGVVWITP